MNEETASEEVVFTLRVPILLNARLIGEAKSESRSRQSHIVYLLNKHFETPNRKDKKQ